MKNKNIIVFMSFLVAGITTLSAFPSVVSYQTAISEIEDIVNTTNNHSTSKFVFNIIFLGNVIRFLYEHFGCDSLIYKLIQPICAAIAIVGILLYAIFNPINIIPNDHGKDD